MHYYLSGGKTPIVPWTKDMFRRFQARNGYNLRPRLPDLFFDIRPLFDLPGVGGNLQDHLDAALLQFCKTRDTYDTANKLVSLYQYWRHKKGPGTSPIAETGGFL